jgi:hypothetical protein
MDHSDHLHDAISMLSARLTGGVEAETEFLEVSGFDNEVCLRQLLFAQTRLAAILVMNASAMERRSSQAVLDSLTLAVVQVHDWERNT